MIPIRTTPTRHKDWDSACDFDGYKGADLIGIAQEGERWEDILAKRAAAEAYEKMLDDLPSDEEMRDGSDVEMGEWDEAEEKEKGPCPSLDWSSGESPRRGSWREP